MTYLLEIERTLPDRVYPGRGMVLPFSGWAWHPTARVRHIALQVGSRAFPAAFVDDLRLNAFATLRITEPGAAQAIAGGFWGLVSVDDALPQGRYDVSLAVEWSDGRRDVKTLSALTVEGPRQSPPAVKSAAGTTQPLLAVCMATYNPPREAFIKQIESLRAQTYANWICIVQDDRSTAVGVDLIREIIGGDPRFQVEFNRRNLGPFRNFERVLERVPAEAVYVALSDQDDIWLPHKLTTLVEKLESENALLVYSDQRIVMADGTVISPTYWTTRRNQYTDLANLLLANTVTGAASVFRRSLLDIALPFPPTVGHPFHDHWLACCALAADRIAYVDAPLYDYIQHSTNVLGHSPFSWRDQAKLAASVLGLLPAAAAALFIRPLRPLVRKVLAGLSAVYQHECRRLIVYSSILRMRIRTLNPEKARALDLFTPRMENHWQLLKLGLFGRSRRLITNNADLRLWSGFAVERATAKWAPKLLGLLLWRSKSRATAWPAPVADVTKEVEHVVFKISPLTLDVRQDAPKRVNIVMPELNVATFFGGYMAKINLAARLAARGHAVRLLLVDQITCSPDHLAVIQREYCINENIFDDIDVEESWDRKRPVAVNPDDVFIATTFWTAHIVNAALGVLGRSRFLYLIQEYEPFTFAMGSFHAIAHASYSFEHDALFSTRLLEEYFENHAVGVFAPERRGKSLHRTFNNAIVRPPTDRPRAPGRRKQLLFYARPEGHAARNLFEIGWAALREAIDKGVLAEDQWEITTIGSPLLPPELAGRSITNLGKKNLKEYRELLQDYDVGMSLMYTPHPSLVPLEMAAAGMVVVTTTCLNKTEEKLRALSPNFIGAEPSVVGVVEGLARAVAEVAATPREARLNRVNWPYSWQESFSDEIMAYIETCLERQHPPAQAGIKRTLAS